MTRRPLRTAALALGSLLLLTGCGGTATNGATVSSGDQQGPLVIGSDNSTESRIVAALYEQLLTAAGEHVTTALTPFAGPADSARAVVRGEIGLTPAYETTLLRAMPRSGPRTDNMTLALSMALPPGVVALSPARAERGVVLAVTKALAGHHTLHALPDLRRAGTRLTLGGPAAGDPDAPTPAALTKAYGVTFTTAPKATTPDVLVLRGTDPVIARRDLVVLADPAAVVPPEHVVPLADAASADRTARDTLARLGARLTTSELAALTARVEAGQAPAEAAGAWLRSTGLLR
ncbi:glycine betaine ABC transporter substrate-binding protein [Streptomyces acidiscabies]|uniref:glycine betaine ABC transporter substrate-binding protein n=1 Tax=Streptomyces acidiscabies TaxID=42234 RepID=UPI00073F334E|nr:glycine betaine ABC transporter substrate-binding protein [Streptomyces acidiscabies]GAQ56045.1 substrate binding domain of ABC-type glycine [Streptomyces acidiscabies]